MSSFAAIIVGGLMIESLGFEDGNGSLSNCELYPYLPVELNLKVIIPFSSKFMRSP